MIVANKSCVFIFSFLFTGENGKKSYETCLSIIQEEKKWKIKNWHRFSIFVFELKIKWTNDPRTVHALKLVSIFQSDAKAKNEIRSSKPFFKVRRKRKAKSNLQICLSMSCENEEWIWHLNSFFPCHRKTVGTKVHALPSIFS